MENALLDATLEETVKHIAAQINSDFLSRENEMKFSHEHWNKLGGQKIHGAFLPLENGGLGMNYKQYAALLNRLAYHSHDNGLNFSVMAHALACLWPLHLHGTSTEVKKIVEAAASGKIILSNAITEEQGGSDVYEMKTVAIKTDGGFSLNGSKSFCSNSPLATHALVYATTAPGKGFFGGITAFLVPLDAPGVKKGSNFVKMGLRTAAASIIDFENVFVPDAYTVGKTGGGALLFQESMVFEKIYMSAAHCGTMQRWLEHMHAFAKTRTSGTQPLAQIQSVQHTMADVKIQLEACKALVNKALRLLETKNLSAKISYAAIVKHFVSNAMVNASQKYLNLFGAQGYKHEAGIEVQVRDFMASTIYSGTNEIQKNIVFSSIN